MLVEKKIIEIFDWLCLGFCLSDEKPQAKNCTQALLGNFFQILSMNTLAELLDQENLNTEPDLPPCPLPRPDRLELTAMVRAHLVTCASCQRQNRKVVRTEQKLIAQLKLLGEVKRFGKAI